MSVGPATERAFGGGHYRELMATFTGSALLTARHGATEVGYLEPSVVVRGEGPTILLLVGRSWKVQAVEWKRRIVWLEPTKQGGKARWQSGGREFSAPLAIRSVLEAGHVTHTVLSKRAVIALDERRNTIPLSVSLEAVEVLGPARYRVWTFGGSVRNRTRMLRQQALGAYRHDGLCIDFRTDPREWKHQAEVTQTPTPVALPNDVLDALLQATKFTDLLPTPLAEREIRRRRLAE